MTTAAASRWRSWRRRACRPSRSSSPCCTPAASSATAAATRCPAACTASACRWSTRCRRSSTSRSAATATSGRRTTSRGAPQGELQRGEPTSETGTIITFLPDADIFESTSRLEFSTLEQRLRETAFLTRGLKISITDERDEGQRSEFQYEGGIEDFVGYLNQNKESIGKKVVYFEGESGEGAVEIAMQWNTTYQESVFSFANNINTHEGGSHMSGFRSALTSQLNRYARDKKLLKEKDDNLSGEDVREGLTAVISVKLADPQFEGQTKTKLGNPGMEGFVRSVV